MRNRPIGLDFPDIGLTFIGKEYIKNGKWAWQGIDVHTKLLVNKAAGEDIGNLYKTMFDITLTSNLVTDSAGMLMSNRARPLGIEQHCDHEIRTYSRLYFYASREDYLKRIQGRGGDLDTLKSTMWKHNSSYCRNLDKYLQETPLCKNPSYHEAYNGDPFEPVWSVGCDILTRVGQPSLVDGFKAYCEGFWDDLEAGGSLF
jgi:hypothetical protein